MVGVNRLLGACGVLQDGYRCRWNCRSADYGVGVWGSSVDGAASAAALHCRPWGDHLLPPQLQLVPPRSSAWVGSRGSGRRHRDRPLRPPIDVQVSPRLHDYD